MMDTGFLQSNGIETLPQFLTSLAIGLLIGLERERKPTAKAGLRTFALVAVFGTLSALLTDRLGSPWLLIAGLLAVAGMIIAAYLNSPADETEADPGTTTIIALILCYGLGAMVWYGLTKLAVMLAVGITILLYFKPELRGISQRLTRRDLVAILQFSVLTFVILPILPNQNFGPYEAFNPHHAWLMVVLISGISLAGYAALHLVGTRYGAPLLGFLGGLVSSTATSLVYARHSKLNADLVHLAAMVILTANLVVLVRLSLLGAAVYPAVLPQLLPVMASGLVLGLASTSIGWKKLKTSGELPLPQTANPMELQGALGFGLLYSIVLLCAAWLSDIAGSRGLYVVALVSGLTDVDAITLSSLHLLELGKLDTHQTVSSITYAYLSNLMFKFSLVLFIGGNALAKRVAIGFVTIAAGLIAGLLFI